MRFLVVDSCLKQQNETFKPRLMKLWVGLNELGLGFHWRRREFTGEEEREVREERETIEKNEWNRARTFYISALDRVGFDPIQRPTLWTVRSRY